MSQSVEVLKRKGKTESQIWTYLSNIEKPYKLKEVQCVHCGEIIKTWQKVDRAESHLKKCQEFKRKHAVNSGDRPLFWMRRGQRLVTNLLSPPGVLFIP